MSNGDINNETTLFDLPNSPEEFGVIVPDSKLRRIDFSGLEFDTARRAIIEYIKTYFPDQFNDFIASNGIMMVTEIVSSVVAKLSLRADLLANEATLPTARTEEAVINHLALINQRIKRQTPAVVDIEISVDSPTNTDIEINPGNIFTVASGPSGESVAYEVYRAPGDWNSTITIGASKRGVIAWGVQGQFAPVVNALSAGGINQVYQIENEQILDDPLFVTVTIGQQTEQWQVIREPIERYGSNDKVVEVNFFENNAVFRFGDNITGQAPPSGANISFRYRVGGGINGRIGVSQIDDVRQISPNPPSNAVVSVRFRNVTPSNGGTDRETIEQAKKRAPRDFAVQNSIVTAVDYAQVATDFTHPVYGSIVKAIATIKTSLNANLVEVYALAIGPNNIPVTPSVGLKKGLETYFSDLNVLTDFVRVYDAKIRPVDINMNVIIDRNYDASIVKEKSEKVITEYFDVSNWSMGEGLFRSNLIEAIEQIDGVSYVDLFEPYDNILPDSNINLPDDVNTVKFNELITEGQRVTNYYYEKDPPPKGE
jgi:hypothetical protein